MSNMRTPLDGGVGIEQEINRQRIVLESAAKFRFFFVALVFAILSFAIQFPIETTKFYLKLVGIFAKNCLSDQSCGKGFVIRFRIFLETLVIAVTLDPIAFQFKLK